MGAASDAGWWAYVPVVLLTLFLNFADIHFLQNERTAPLHRSVSFWLYLLAHALVALTAAFLLYEKAGASASDWWLVSMAAAFAGFSVLQSFTVKFGDKGIDARDLFDAWKRRVIAEIGEVNVSRKRARQMKVARALARRLDRETLDTIVRQLAESVDDDPDAVTRALTVAGNPRLNLAHWIASMDVQYAEILLAEGESDAPRPEPPPPDAVS